MSSRHIVAIALTLVVIAVIGLLYLQAVTESRATREAWMATQDIVPGAVLDSSNVERVHVPSVGDHFAILTASPLGHRAAHRMAATTLLGPDDLLGDSMAQVPVSVRAAPPVTAGDTLDVYAVVGPRTVLVGRHLVVVAGGSPMTLLVPAADEPSWIALQADNVSLFAARSSGADVPRGPGLAVNDAIATLSGSAG